LNTRASAITTHLCAGASIFYAARLAAFNASWLELPLIERPRENAPFVSIVVPARDEERQIEDCVRSLLAQEWLDFELIVVDDRSSDATNEILQRIAFEDPRLRVVTGKALPVGWVGKSWALHQGSLEARAQWLLFTDADTRHDARSVASALFWALEMGVDALSLVTRQELGSLAERAVLPSIFNMIMIAVGTLGAINDPKRPNAIVNGQYLMVRREAYEALGGHVTLRREIAEDLAFARHLKRDGRFRLSLAVGTQFASVRMYRSLREIWGGFSKNSFYGTDGSVLKLAGGIAFMLATSLAPPVLAVRALTRRRYVEAAEALACTVATSVAAAWMAGRFHMPRRLGFFQPLGTAAFAAIMLDSAVRVLSGRGVAWRGRTYSGRPAPR